MSDVTVAPSGDSAPSAAPENEVAIDTNPVSTPQPIGSQAPEKPSRREAVEAAVQAAYDRAEKGSKEGLKAVQRAAPKPAEAKPGHNQPPEETPKEKLDLKKPPGEQPRDRGRFAPREQGEANGQARSGLDGQATGQTAQNGQVDRTYKQLPPNTPYAEPPPRMAEHGRRDWADTPETVRGEVHRMNAEFANAYHQMKGAADAFMPVAQYHQMAIEHGTTLQQALHNYTSIEMKLREDPVAALDVIVNNLGLKSPDGQKLTFRDICYHVLSQSPEQLKQLQQGNQQNAAQHQIGALYREVMGLKQAQQEMHNAARFNYTRSAVDQFAASHPRFDELGEIVRREIELGFDIETAYRRAELLMPGPSTQAAQTRTPSAQTRPADKSISGSPGVTGSNPAHRRPEKQVGRREALEYAFNHANGGL